MSTKITKTPGRVSTDNTASVGRPAVFDQDEFRSLADGLDDPVVALDFLSRYLGMLPVRLDRIARALEAEDSQAAMDALLSLRTPSSMAGALEAAFYCYLLQDSVRDGNFALALNQASLLSDSVASLVAAGPALLRRMHPGFGAAEEWASTENPVAA